MLEASTATAPKKPEVKIFDLKGVEFPRYHLKVEGERAFYSRREAAQLLDSGGTKVEFGRYVMEKPFAMRLITQEDKDILLAAAHEWGEHK